MNGVAGRTVAPRDLWLIQRAPRPAHYHPDVPYHPIVICARRAVLEEERGWTGDRASVWWHEAKEEGSGWLMRRWQGFDIDYGHTVRGLALPDGTHAAFAHDRAAAPWTLLPGAVFLDDRPMPAWLEAQGVVYPPDERTRDRLIETILGEGAIGLGRRAFYPAHWPPATVTSDNAWQVAPLSGEAVGA